jgi:hypothetical protein
MGDKEAVEHTEGDGRDGEEVHGRDGFSMVSQKDEPTFGGLRISRCSADPTGDHHRLRADDDECLFPSRPELARQNPRPYRTLLVLASDVCASVLRVVGEEPGFPEAGFDERGRVEESRQKKVSGIPFRLWTATSHPVEIKGGQNFGERQE